MSSRLRVLRYPNFRYLFLGQAVSAVGDRVVVVALALFVTRRGGSATDLSLVLCAQALPLVALLALGGVWADRVPRRRIMIATDCARAVLHGVLALLIVIGAAGILELIVIEALFGAAEAFFAPAYSGLLPQTVPAELIQEAQALIQSTMNVAFVVGPALASALVLGVGAAEAFAFDAATFVLGVALLMRVRARPPACTPARASLRSELRGGWREVRSRPWLLVTIVAFCGALPCIFAPWYALAPSIAARQYGSVGIFGLLESVVGVGAVIGAVVGLRWRPALPLRTGLLLTLTWPLLTAAFALRAPLAALVPLAAATGFGFALLGVWWEAALATHIPEHARSRVSSYDLMGSLALLPAGYALAGPLAGAVGAGTVLGVGSAIAFVLLLVALVPHEPNATVTAAMGDEARSRGRAIATTSATTSAAPSRRRS